MGDGGTLCSWPAAAARFLALTTDGFRLYHTPGPFWRFPLKLRSIPTTPKGTCQAGAHPLTPALKNETLSIRIAGVDAPELAHFGNPAQPHAKESLQWLTSAVEGKRVKCQLLRKDQYGRIVRPFLTIQLTRRWPCRGSAARFSRTSRSRS